MFAIDYDGTIAATNAVKSRWIREHLGLDVPPWLCDHTSCSGAMSEEEYQRIARDVYSEAETLRAAPVPGAPEALQALAVRGPVYVVTARMPEQVAASRRWLENHGLAGCVRDIVSAAGDEKIALAERLGCRALVDDDGRHLRGEASGLLRIHLRAGMPGRAAMKDGVLVCTTWQDALAAALDAAARG